MYYVSLEFFLGEVSVIFPLYIFKKFNSIQSLINYLLINQLQFLASLIIRDAYYFTPPKEDTFSRIMYLVSMKL